VLLLAGTRIVVEDTVWVITLVSTTGVDSVGDDSVVEEVDD
jgi:hypothetical protein